MTLKTVNNICSVRCSFVEWVSQELMSFIKKKMNRKAENLTMSSSSSLDSIPEFSSIPLTPTPDMAKSARRLMAGSNKQFEKITQTIALRKRELQKGKREEREASKKETARSTEM